MSICIVTLFTREIMSYAWNTSKQKQDYAHRNGYGFISYHQAIDYSRPPSWSKVIALIKALEMGDWRWAFWSDADSIIVKETRLEQYLDDEHDIIIAGDRNGGFNCGNFFIRNSPSSLAFLRTAYEQVEFINHSWWEQSAFLHLFRASFPIKILKGDFDFNIRDTSRSANAFIWHLPGVLNRHRIEQFNKFILGHDLQSRLDVCTLLNKLGTDLVGAIVGTDPDLFAQAILSHCNIGKLHFTNALRIVPTREGLDSIPCNVGIDAEISSDDPLPVNLSLNEIQVSSLDFIYVDTEMSFSEIELDSYYSKVRPDGIICGNCYFDRQGEGYFFGTKSVVDDFVKAMDLDHLFVTTDQSPFWIIFKRRNKASQKPFMKRIDKIKALKPLKEFTSDDEKSQLAHLNHDSWLYSSGNSRLVCSLLGALHEELEERPDLQKIILEVVWMARRMNDTRRNQVDMWKGHHSAEQITKYQKLAREYIKQIPNYHLARYQGRGIVIPGGGTRYFACAWVNIKMLRHLGCELPIEFWHLGSKEMSDEMRALLAPLGVKAVDALQIRKIHPSRILNGWELKPYCIIHSGFEEVIMLDADNIPVIDPTFLFDTPQYHEQGAIFCPDHGRLGSERAIWKFCEVEYRNEPEFESGQIVVDKRRCWHALQLTMHYNEHSDMYYQLVHGDKDTFHLAWRKLGLGYAMPSKGIHSLQGTNCQHDFDGRRIFQHRNYDKWNLDGANKKVPGFVNEDLCLSFLNELRELWKRH